MRNYVLPEFVDGNRVLEGEESVLIVGPAIGFYTSGPIAQQTTEEYAPEALEDYATGSFGLGADADMEALYNRVVELTDQVLEIKTILANLGLCRVTS